MPFYGTLKPPQFAPGRSVEGFESYREAVIWCWENRVNSGAGEKLDQSLCANQIGLHTPHMSRCVNRFSNAPMNLSPDLVPGFEAFCGWRAVSQYMAKVSQLTFMEQVIAEKRFSA
jgi:hypothetical protein